MNTQLSFKNILVLLCLKTYEHTRCHGIYCLPSIIYLSYQVLDVCRSIMNSGLYRTQCIVCGREDKKLRFFRFPKHTERCRNWLRVIGIKDLIYMSLSELFKQIVCEIHFHPRCFSGVGKRLLKMALPSMFTSHSPLPANIMAGWPPKNDQVPQMQQITQVNKGVNRDPTLCESGPVINYEKPLMTCMETLINNKQDFSKKLAGMPNTISVPLMTYCNSLEKGTVFAPDEPADLLDLPVIIIENIDLNPTATKKSMQSYTTDSKLTKKYHGKRLPGNIDVLQQYGTVNKHQTKYRAGTPIHTMVHPYNTGTLQQYTNKKAKDLHSMHTNAPDISLSSFTGSMKECNTTIKKEPVVSIGLKTIIRSRKSRAELASPTTPTRNHSDRVLGLNPVQATTDSNINLSGTQGPNTLYMEHERTTTDREHFAIPDIPKRNSSCPRYGYTKTANKFIQYAEHVPTVLNTNTNFSGTPGRNALYMEHEQTTTDSVTMNTEYFAIPDIRKRISSCPRYGYTKTANKFIQYAEHVPTVLNTNTNFCGTPGRNALYMEHEQTTTDSVTKYAKTANKFIQYAEHVRTVSRESRDAHSSDVNIDYNMPLLNCMGTILQGNVNYHSKPEDSDNDSIEVPLLTCMKIIQSIQ